MAEGTIFNINYFQQLFAACLDITFVVCSKAYPKWSPAKVNFKLINLLETILYLKLVQIFSEKLRKLKNYWIFPLSKQSFYSVCKSIVITNNSVSFRMFLVKFSQPLLY